MYQITTKKPSGSISGVQLKDNGAIEYSRDLPQDCRISYGLKKIVTPLLAGLLEADPKRIWTFERFFREVTSILSCKVVHFFHVNRVSIDIFNLQASTHFTITQPSAIRKLYCTICSTKIQLQY